MAATVSAIARGQRTATRLEIPLPNPAETRKPASVVVDRRQRMSEKQGETVDESDLDEQKGETNQQKIDCNMSQTWCLTRFLAASQPCKRQQDQDRARDDRLQHREDDDQVSGIDEHESTLPP
jgi:hypothetical protein